MAGVDKPFLRGVDMWKGQYFKRKEQNSNPLNNTPIHFVPKSEKTEEWKAAISDYYEYIGLSKVSYAYDGIIKNRWLSSGQLDINDYKKSKKTHQYEIFQKNGIDYNIPKQAEDHGFEFYPLIPNLVNLFTGYQLKRNNKYIFSLVDEFSKAELFDIKDEAFKAQLRKVMMAMRDSSISQEDPNYEQLHAQMVESQLKFKNYKDVAVEWANRVHKINYEKFGLRNLIKQAFKESYLSSSKVIFHINMLKDRFHVEHIDEAFAFNGAITNSVNVTDSGLIGWFKWMNIGELLTNFGKVFTDEDIEKLKNNNKAIANGNLSLVDPFNVESVDRSNQGGTSALVGSAGYDPSKPYQAQPNEPLDIARYKRHMQETTGLSFNNQTTVMSNPDINPEFTYGIDKIYRVMYLYVESQRRIGWLTKIDKTGQIELQKWIDEDFKVTEQPIYDYSKIKEDSIETLIYGEHIDWEWVPDWRRFITLSPNSSHSSFNTLGINLEKIYIDGNSLDFQFKNDKTPYGVKPPVVGIEIKQRGVKAVPVVTMLKQDQVIYNICKNRVRQVLAQDRGLVLAYNTNTISRFDSDIEDDGELIKNYEDNIKKNKTLRQTYDKQWLQGAGGQMSAPTVLNLSTLDEALKYDQLAERVWYNALRTVGVTPQAMGEIKASEEVSNANAAQQISQVQTELIYDEFNSRLLPDLFQKILEATQYYSTINEDFRLMYLNDNDENTWLDITGINLLHKDIVCTAKYQFDNEEFTSLVKRLAFDNTIQESMLTRLKVFAKADENISKVLTILEESELKTQEANQKLEDAKREDLKAQQNHEQLLLDKELDNINKQKELDRKSKEYIGELNVLGGGLQTDANANSEIDSVENFKMILKQRELQNKEKQQLTSNSLIEKMHSDDISIKKEQLLQKDRSDSMKLKQAVINRNASSDKKLDKQVLKK